MQTVPMPETDSFEYTIPTFSVSAHKNEAIVFALQHLLHYHVRSLPAASRPQAAAVMKVRMRDCRAISVLT